MIIFLYGEDNYSSHEKLHTLKKKFIEKNGDLNLSVFEGAKMTSLNEFKTAVETLPFLGNKKMIIVINLLSQNKKLLDTMAEYLEKIPDNVFAVFYEDGSSFDRRKKLFKRLSKEKHSQEFKTLQGYLLNKWITKKVKEKNGKITSQAVNELASSVNGNLWQLENDISKMTLYKKGTDKAITATDVKKFVKSAIQSNIFKMIDYIGQKNTKEACQELAFLKESGENEIYILTMMVYQFRNLIQARDVLNQGGNSYDLRSRAKIHPFVAKKSMKQAQNFTLKELKKIYNHLLKIDLGIKTGKLDPNIALDQFIVETG